MEKDGVCASDVHETTYLGFLSRAPLLPIEYADSAYIIFVELLDHPVPPKNVAIFVGGGSKVEPLSDESAIADVWEQSIPNSPGDVEHSGLQDDHLSL